MRATITIEYDVKRDQTGETEQDEQKVQEAIQAELEGYIESIRRRCETEGLNVNITSG